MSAEQIGTAELADPELVELCRAGDEEAWSLLVERYSRYVYAIAVRGFGLAEAEAEDVFQETFLRVYERLGGLRDPAALRPWIGQVTRRLCLDRLSAARRETVADEPPDAAATPLEAIEEAMDVHEALRQLDERCRELLDRFFARDEPYRVIADELDLPMGTVASRISRCLDKLRDVLGEGRKPGSPAS